MFHLGGKVFVTKEKFCEVARETARSSHIQRLTEEAGAAMGLDVSTYCASGKSATRPNKFPPALVSIAQSTMIYFTI